MPLFTLHLLLFSFPPHISQSVAVLFLVPPRCWWQSHSSGGACPAPDHAVRRGRWGRGGLIWGGRGRPRAASHGLLHLSSSGRPTRPQRQQLRDAGHLQPACQHHGPSADPGGCVLVRMLGPVCILYDTMQSYMFVQFNMMQGSVCF